MLQRSFLKKTGLTAENFFLRNQNLVEISDTLHHLKSLKKKNKSPGNLGTSKKG
jgi:hypothetical protein